MLLEIVTTRNAHPEYVNLHPGICKAFCVVMYECITDLIRRPTAKELPQDFGDGTGGNKKKGPNPEEYTEHNLVGTGVELLVCTMPIGENNSSGKHISC